MSHTNNTIVNLLSEMLGFPRKYSSGQADVPFNCPRCDAGHNKYNLEVNLSKLVFNCWSCAYRGKLTKLFVDHASSRQWDVLNSLSLSRSEQVKPASVEQISIGSHRSLTVEWNDSLHYRAAITYIKRRGITDTMIRKWDMCYSESGQNAYRIIIPSRGPDGELQYFIARGFYDSVWPKYKNAAVEKTDIIFGEQLVDWRRPIVLTEGVFDAMVALNGVPILGTTIRSHKKLLTKIRSNNTPCIVCLDHDARLKAKDAYKLLDDLGVDVSIAYVPEEFGDLSSAYELAGKKAVLDIIDSAHKMTLQEFIF